MNLKKVNLIMILIVVALFNVTAILTWQKLYNTHINGDEPHYIVLASAIADFGEIEQTRAYTKASYTKGFYHPIHSYPPPKKGVNYSEQTILSSNGLFTIHGIGLSLLIAPAYKLYGITGVKIFLIMLFSISIILLWFFMTIFNLNIIDKIILIISTLFAFPFLTASNQIYPSLPAAIISLFAILWILYRPSLSKKYVQLYDIIVLILIAYQPLIHIKYLAPALIATTAVIYISNEKKISYKQIALYLLPILLSIVLLASYNLYAYNDITGPYSQGSLTHVGSLALNKTALAVLLGLHIDQFQGIFMQNPLMFVGLLFLVPFIRWNWKVGILTVLLYFSFIVPNAMHPYWYGGFSYVGRFAWSSSLLWMLPTLYGLIQIRKHRFTLFYILIIVSILIQIYFLTKFMDGNFSLYNNLHTNIYHLNTFYAPYQNYFPSFLNDTWTYTYGTNYVYIFFFISLVFMGKYYSNDNIDSFFKKIKFYFIFMIFIIITVSIFSSHIPPKV